MDELRKYVLDLRVVAVCRLHERYVLLRLTQDDVLPMMRPGQFVEVRVEVLIPRSFDDLFLSTTSTVNPTNFGC